MSITQKKRASMRRLRTNACRGKRKTEEARQVHGNWGNTDTLANLNQKGVPFVNLPVGLGVLYTSGCWLETTGVTIQTPFQKFGGTNLNFRWRREASINPSFIVIKRLPNFKLASSGEGQSKTEEGIKNRRKRE